MNQNHEHGVENSSDVAPACLPSTFDWTGFRALLQQSFPPLFTQGYRIINQRCVDLSLLVVERYQLFRDTPPVETMDTLAQKIGLAPQARYVVERMMTVLTEEGYLFFQDAAWTAIHPFPPPARAPVAADALPEMAHDPIFEFFRRCEENLFGFLEGKRIGAAIIFPRGDPSFWLDLNNHSLFFAPYAHLAAFAGESCLVPRARILEIGAGTGAATAQQLARMSPDAISRYVYTDISKVFLQEGRRRFGHHPFIEYHLFNFNTSPTEQGLEEGSFDLILGVNALHVARYLPSTLSFLVRLLRPEGWLVIGEGAPPANHRMWRPDLLFGWLEGWWNVETDPTWRTQPGWLMPSAWEALFQAAGMVEVCAVPGEASFTGDCYGGVVIGRAPAEGADL